MLLQRILKEILELKKEAEDEFKDFGRNLNIVKEGLYEFNDFHDQIFEFSTLTALRKRR